MSLERNCKGAINVFCMPRYQAGLWKLIVPKKRYTDLTKTGRSEISTSTSIDLTNITSCCIWLASRWLCRCFSLDVNFRIIEGSFLAFEKLWGWSDPTQCWESTSVNELSPNGPYLQTSLVVVFYLAIFLCLSSTSYRRYIYMFIKFNLLNNI